MQCCYSSIPALTRGRMNITYPTIFAHIYIILSLLLIVCGVKRRYPRFFIIHDGFLYRLYRSANPTARDLAFFSFFIVNDDQITVIRESTKIYYAVFVFLWPLLHAIVVYARVLGEVGSLFGRKAAVNNRKKLFAKDTNLVDFVETIVELGYVGFASSLLAKTYNISVEATQQAFVSVALTLGIRELLSLVPYLIVSHDYLGGAFVPGQLI